MAKKMRKLRAIKIFDRVGQRLVLVEKASHKGHYGKEMRNRRRRERLAKISKRRNRKNK